ncbi:MAG TPA: maltotransferase domain-containing protein, partial [Dokdonella sp.]
LAAACAEHGLALWLDFAPDVCAASGTDARARPALYDVLSAIPDAEPPDPRRPPQRSRAASARFADVQAAADLGALWRERLRGWIDVGVGGFRCVAPQRVPAPIWRALIAAAREHAGAVRFGAWTPGLTPAELAALEGCGFDSAYSSLPWWDFRADWWLEEDERLRRVGTVCAPLGAPDAGPVIAPDDAEHRHDLRRRLAFAAAVADALLMPWRCVATALADDTGAPAEDAAAWRADVAAANAAIAARAAGAAPRVRDLLGANAPLLAWLLEDAAAPRVVLANRDLDRVVVVPAAPILRAAAAFARLAAPDAAAPLGPDALVALEPGEVRVLAAAADEPVLAAIGDDALGAAARAPRVALANPSPCVDDGRYAVKRTLGERVHVEVDAFADGHDVLAVELLWRAADAKTWSRTRMRELGNDRWAAEFPLERLGRHEYTVQAWRDGFATARRDLEKKRAAGVLQPLDVDDACRLVADAARARGAAGAALRAWSERLAAAAADERVGVLLDPALGAAMAAAGAHEPASELTFKVPVECERLAARYASWYELFPRSLGTRERHGTFDDVIARLPAIRDMGFDV